MNLKNNFFIFGKILYNIQKQDVIDFIIENNYTKGNINMDTLTSAINAEMDNTAKFMLVNMESTDKINKELINLAAKNNMKNFLLILEENMDDKNKKNI
jgi:Peptidoglycan-synthase activator LpoB